MALSSIRPESMADDYLNVEVESVLRLRPLLKKERDDSVVLEPQNNVMRNAPATAVLHPLHTLLASPVSGSSLRSRSESDATNITTPTDYHFNHVLSENTSQDKIYYLLGLPIATAAMSSLKAATAGRSSKMTKSHLLICMGITNSGKSYTCFGGTSIPKRRASQDGLVPRLVDSLFSQSKHHASSGSKGFAVNISVMQVSHSKGDPNACQIQDLLAAPTKTPTKNKVSSASPKRLLTVRSMAAKFERALPSPIRSPLKSKEFAELDPEDLRPTFESCRDVAQAREVLQNGLNASKKAAKGQNHHMLITIQPVVNGSQFGDKIAILDMAGLEKGKKNQSRGKDSVNMNQAAGAAVLHCLRTMIHNANVRNGRSDPLDIVSADDAASEISCVSQEKHPVQRRLKPVPFRHHKVTMLLHPIFTSSVSTRVTVLLNAYPGHADYHEKKLLLQDTELLCGVALLSSNAAVATGLERGESRSVFSTDSRSTYSKATEEDAESVDQDPVHIPRRLPAKRAVLLLSKERGESRSVFSTDSRSTFGKVTEEDAESIDQDPVRIPWRLPEKGGVPNREMSNKSSTLSASRDEDEKVIPHPPAYAPSFSKVGSLSSATIRPSAPPAEPLETIAPPLQESKAKLNPPKNPSFVSDFPGVALPSNTMCNSPISERRRVTTTVSSAMVGGPKARAPPPTGDEDKQSATTRQHTVRAALASNVSRPKRLNAFDSRDDSRVPLGRSSLENGRSSIENIEKTDKKSSARSAMRVIENIYSGGSRQLQSQPRNLGDLRSNQPSSSPRNTLASQQTDFQTSTKMDRRIEQKKQECLSSPKSSYSSHRRDASNDTSERSQTQDSEKRVKELEAQVKEILRQKRALERKYNDLEKENQELKSSIREPGCKQMQLKWTSQDEDEFLKSRKLRLEEQNLVKAPLLDHLEKVNYIYDIKNQWCKSDKPHFSLKFPKYFQRAPALDIRDKDNVEKEAAMGDGGNVSSYAAMPAVKLTYESHGNGHNNSTGVKRSPLSTGRNSLSALRRLALKGQ